MKKDLTTFPISIYKEDLASTLYCWLAEHLTEREVSTMAKEIGFSLRGIWRLGINKGVYEQFYRELFILYMYLIVLTCRGNIDQEYHKDAVLEQFHAMVYEKNVKVTKVEYNRWMAFMNHMYHEYDKAMASESLLAPPLLIADAFENSLFKKKRLTPYTKFEFSMRITGMVKHLSEIVKGYTVID